MNAILRWRARAFHTHLESWSFGWIFIGRIFFLWLLLIFFSMLLLSLLLLFFLVLLVSFFSLLLLLLFFRCCWLLVNPLWWDCYPCALFTLTLRNKFSKAPYSEHVYMSRAQLFFFLFFFISLNIKHILHIFRLFIREYSQSPSLHSVLSQHFWLIVTRTHTLTWKWVRSHLMLFRLPFCWALFHSLTWSFHIDARSAYVNMFVWF